MPDAMPKAPPGIKPRPGAGPPPRPRTASRTTSKTKIKDGLEGYTQLAALGLALSGDQWSSKVFEIVGPTWAQSMADVAAINPQVEKALMALVEGGTWGAAIGSSVCLIAPVVAARVPGMSQSVRETIAMAPVTLGQVTKDQFREFMEEQQAYRNAAAAAENGAS